MVLSAVALGRALGFVSTHTHILSHHTCIFRSFVHLFNKAERNCILDLQRQGSTTRSSISRRCCRSSRCRTSPSSRDKTRSTGSHIRSFWILNPPIYILIHTIPNVFNKCLNNGGLEVFGCQVHAYSSSGDPISPAGN